MKKRLVRFLVVCYDAYSRQYTAAEYFRITDRQLKDCLYALPTAELAHKAQYVLATEDGSGRTAVLKNVFGDRGLVQTVL